MLINILEILSDWDMFYYLFSAFSFCGVFYLLKFLIFGNGKGYDL